MVTLPAVQGVANEVLKAFGGPLMNLLVAVILLLVGLLISRVLQLAATYVLKTIGLDTLSERMGFNRVLAKGDVHRTPAELLGNLTYWVFIYVTLVTVAALYGLVAPGEIMGMLMPYIGAAITAILILGVAIFLGGVVSGFITVVANNTGIAYSRFLAKVAQYAVVISSFVMVLGILGFKTEWIVTSMTVIVASIGLAFAISFGLGSKDMASGFLAHLVKK